MRVTRSRFLVGIFLTIVTAIVLAASPRALSQERTEANRFAAATQTVAREVGRRTPSVQRDLRSIGRQLNQCDAFADDDFSGVRADVTMAVVTLPYLHAVFSPIGGPLARFTRSLLATKPSDPALRAGANAWYAVVKVRRRLSHGHRHFCAAFTRWKRRGFPKARRPVSRHQLEVYRDFMARIADAHKKTSRASQRLVTLGVDKAVAKQFTYDYLISLAEYGPTKASTVCRTNRCLLQNERT